MKTLEQPSEAFGTPTPKRWTVEECDTFREMGFLEGGRYELIEGVIVDKMGHGNPHSRAICALMNLLATLFGLEKIRVQLPIRIEGELGRVNEPLPDVALTRESYEAYDETPTPNDLLLVAEVSDSSLRFDLTTKARLYARAGVGEYWVLDIEKNSVIVHREPTSTGYESVTEWETGEALSPLALPSASVLVSSLFPPSKPIERERHSAP